MRNYVSNILGSCRWRTAPGGRHMRASAGVTGCLLVRGRSGRAGSRGRKWWRLKHCFRRDSLLRAEDTSPQLLLRFERAPPEAQIYVPEARFPAFYLVRTEDDEVFAIVRLAPESGCLVEWNEDEGRFQDPCDGRLYDRRGVPVGGQGRALYHLAYERSEIDMVMIDLGRRVPNPHM